MKSKWNGINEYYSLKVFPNYSGWIYAKKKHLLMQMLSLILSCEKIMPLLRLPH